MGYIHAVEARERLGRLEGLRIHLTANFYPPIPFEVRQSVLEAFQAHWKRAKTPEALLKDINRRLSKAKTGWQWRKLDRFDIFLT